jgi:hypothetical protein
MVTDFEAAFKLPYSSWKKLFIGAGFFVIVWIMSFIPVTGLNTLLALLVTTIPLGYALMCAKFAAQKRFVMPEWANFKELFTTGISAIAVSLIYLLPVIILVAVLILLVLGAVGGSVAALAVMMNTDPALIFPMLGGAIALAVIILLLLVLIYYLMPMAWMKMINEGFGAAFDFKDIFKRAFTVKYFLGVLFAYTLNILILVVGMLVAFLLILTLVGPLIAYGLAVMIAYIVMMAIYGQLYAETATKKVAPIRAVKKK